MKTVDRIEGLLDFGCRGLDNEDSVNFEKDLQVINKEVRQLTAEVKELKNNYKQTGCIDSGCAEHVQELLKVNADLRQVIQNLCSDIDDVNGCHAPEYAKKHFPKKGGE